MFAFIVSDPSVPAIPTQHHPLPVKAGGTYVVTSHGAATHLYDLTPYGWAEVTFL